MDGKPVLRPNESRCDVRLAVSQLMFQQVFGRCWQGVSVKADKCLDHKGQAFFRDANLCDVPPVEGQKVLFDPVSEDDATFIDPR